MLAFLKKGNKWSTWFWFCRLLFSILHVTAHILPLMLSVLFCLWAMYAWLFCYSLKEWNSGPLEVHLSFANDLSGARILLLVVISVFCQKRYVKYHSIYLCLWFCLLLNTSAVSAIWWYFVVGCFVDVGVLLLFDFYFMAGRNLVFILIIFVTKFEVFHLCLTGRTRFYF